jgi:hypothetical protein
VGDRLRDALNEGRIDLTEYDERLQQAFAAKTYGELDKLLADLPGVTPAQNSQLATPEPTPSPAAPDAPAAVSGTADGRSRGWIGIWGGWLTASVITTGIWAATALTSDRAIGFWPIWVILPFGAVCLATTLRHLAGDETAHTYRRDRAARRARRDRYRNR